MLPKIVVQDFETRDLQVKAVCALCLSPGTHKVHCSRASNPLPSASQGFGNLFQAAAPAAPAASAAVAAVAASAAPTSSTASPTLAHSALSVQPQSTYALKKNFASDLKAYFDAVAKARGLDYSVCAGNVTSKLVLLRAGVGPVEVPDPLLLGLLLDQKRCPAELRRCANHPVTFAAEGTRLVVDDPGMYGECQEETKVEGARRRSRTCVRDAWGAAAGAAVAASTTAVAAGSAPAAAAFVDPAATEAKPCRLSQVLGSEARRGLLDLLAASVAPAWRRPRHGHSAEHARREALGCIAPLVGDSGAGGQGAELREPGAVRCGRQASGPERARLVRFKAFFENSAQAKHDL